MAGRALFLKDNSTSTLPVKVDSEPMRFGIDGDYRFRVPFN
jgi:hypothetical protein